MLLKQPRQRLDASDMKQKIYLMREGVPVQNTSSGVWTTTTDTTISELWAGVNNLSGTEYWTARSAQAENTLIFKVFYNTALDGITPKDYIKWGEKIYDIDHIDNLFYENNIVKIKAVIRT